MRPGCDRQCSFIWIVERDQHRRPPDFMCAYIGKSLQWKQGKGDHHQGNNNDVKE